MKLGESLLKAIRLVLTDEDCFWLDGLRAELQEIEGGREQAFWLGGAIALALVSLKRRLLDEAGLIALTGIGGAVLAYVDLEASTRLPYFALLLTFVAVVSLIKAELPWPFLWAALAGFCLPLFVMLGFKGPYVHDTGDTTFPVLPALAVALLVSWLRRRWDADHGQNLPR